MKMKKYSGKTSTAAVPLPEDKILLVKRNMIPFKGC
jgi:ADP-ribose pyrophosphatase YjhB (NUDIX family)